VSNRGNKGGEFEKMGEPIEKRPRIKKKKPTGARCLVLRKKGGGGAGKFNSGEVERRGLKK